VRDTPAFTAKLLGRLLENAADEYEESIKSGRIVRPVEYQDAYGFVRRVQALCENVPGVASPRATTVLERLRAAFPGVMPPRKPVPASQVRALIGELTAVLADSVQGGS
jgi:hypothetical protein